MESGYGPGDKLGHVHDLYFRLFLSPQPGCTLLKVALTGWTGRNYGISSRVGRLPYPLVGDLQAHSGVISLQPSSTATACSKVPVLGKFNQLHTRDGLDQIAWWIIDVHMTTHVAGIVVGDPSRNSILHPQCALRNELIQIFHSMVDTNAVHLPVRRIQIFECPVTSGAGGDDLFESHLLEQINVLFDTPLEGIPFTHQVGDVTTAVLLGPQGGIFGSCLVHDGQGTWDDIDVLV